MRNAAVVLLAVAMPLTVVGQVSSSPSTKRTPAPPTTQVQPGAGLGAGTLAQVNQVIENARVDLARLRIEKWKADSNLRRQSESNADSLQRNMTSALPVIVEEVRANPNSVASAFKLYRNLNALYEVMASLTESAGAFGPKDEYQALAKDSEQLDNVRRSLAEQVQSLASARDAQAAQFQTNVHPAASSSAASSPKKIIVDDNEPEKKSAKKSVKKKKTTTASETQSPPKQ